MNLFLSLKLTAVIALYFFHGEGDALDKGKAAHPHEYRFTVLINGTVGVDSTKFNLCHGVLVSPYIVLGSAKKACWDKPLEELSIEAGMHDVTKSERTVQIREVCQIDVHPSAGSNDLTNQYVIYHVSDPFVFNNNVGSIHLPLIENLSTVNSCIFASWGNAEKLSVPHHRVLDIKPCTDDGTYFCTGPGPCNDIGAPLVCAVGNREFTVGVYISGGCGSKDASFSAFYNKDFLGWYKNSVKAVPKECKPTHG